MSYKTEHMNVFNVSFLFLDIYYYLPSYCYYVLLFIDSNSLRYYDMYVNFTFNEPGWIENT